MRPIDTRLQRGIEEFLPGFNREGFAAGDDGRLAIVFFEKIKQDRATVALLYSRSYGPIDQKIRRGWASRHGS